MVTIAYLRVHRVFPACRLIFSSLTHFRSYQYWVKDILQLIEYPFTHFCPRLVRRQYGGPVRLYGSRLFSAKSMGVGESFDIIAGRSKRAPLWMQKSGLEWCYRIYQEPGRMWRRYAKTNPVFVWMVLKEYIKRRARHSS